MKLVLPPRHTVGQIRTGAHLSLIMPSPFFAAYALAVAGATACGLSGYALLGWSFAPARSRRLLSAPVVGLALVLWLLSVVNLLLPLGTIACVVLLLPLLVVGGVRRLRLALVSDLRAARSWAAPALLGLLTLLALPLCPLLGPGDLAFFDGTGNHDSFFWITGAARLQEYPYIDDSVSTLGTPLAWSSRVFLGWQPHWGRMGAEGLLAAVASLVRADPVEIALPVMTGLLVPWLATTAWLARTAGWWPRSMVVAVGACLLQPLAFFTLFNGNYPNLLGVIVGTGWLLSVQAVPNDCPQRTSHVLGSAFLLHGVLVTYPELLPFAGLPAVLILIATRQGRIPSCLLHLTLVALLSVALNPVTTWRATSGFLTSFSLARGDEGWRSLFDGLSVFSYFPGWVTLSRDTVSFLDPWVTAAWSAALVLAAWSLLQRNRRRWIVLGSLSGFALLAAYTAITSFSYGWQKSAQFSALALSCLGSFGLLHLLSTAANKPLIRAAAALAAAGAALAVVDLVADAVSSARTKGITRGMLALAAEARVRGDGPVLVLDDSFSQPFFHGMWASYLFRQNQAMYPSDALAAGGYLADEVKRFEPTRPPENALAYYVGREWADQHPGSSRAADRVAALLWHRPLTTTTTAPPRHD